MNYIDILFKFIYNNFTPILGGITLFSFILNLVQYRTHRMFIHVFSGVYHTANRTYIDNNSNKKSNEELISILISIRHQAVTGLRLSGRKYEYSDIGSPQNEGFVYRILASIFHVLLAIRLKLPLLFKSTKN